MTSEHQPPAQIPESSAAGNAHPGRGVLSDPRALTILTTEH